jgi:hypothetical protein
MILSIKKELNEKTGRNHTILTMKCDECGAVFSTTRCVKAKQMRTHHFHSKRCAAGSKLVKEQRTQTCLTRYGVEHPLQSKEIWDKYKKTCLSLYGVEHAFSDYSVQKKRADTMIKRHGKKHALQIEKFKKKQEQTCVDRYGTTNVFNLPEYQSKVHQTLLKRYGVEHALQDPAFFIKAQKNKTKKQVINHWKTGSDLTCTGSYEVAFVNWCNQNKIDFDWQIQHKMPDGRVYIIDALIKDGEFANTWIEIKGWLTEKSKQKWEWFHSTHVNSQLWNKQRLSELKIL